MCTKEVLLTLQCCCTVVTESKFSPRNMSRISPKLSKSTIENSDTNRLVPKILDFDHFGEILDIFRGGNLLSVSNVSIETVFDSLY